jgi:hypothetical protein
MLASEPWATGPGGFPPEPSQIRAWTFPPLGSSVKESYEAVAQIWTQIRDGGSGCALRSARNRFQVWLPACWLGFGCAGLPPTGRLIRVLVYIPTSSPTSIAWSLPPTPPWPTPILPSLPGPGTLRQIPHEPRENKWELNWLLHRGIGGVGR